MKETKIIDVVDLMFLKCIEDTLKDERICRDYLVEKSTDHIDDDKGDENP